MLYYKRIMQVIIVLKLSVGDCSITKANAGLDERDMTGNQSGRDDVML